jgi:uncharacterized repeat protein (TIGR01451 family)
MKKMYTLLLVMSLFHVAGFSQTTSYSFYADTMYGCQTTFGVQMTIGTLAETGGVLSVDWGDGNTTTYNYSTTAGNITQYTQVTHGYTLPGNYVVSFNIYSGTAGADVDAGQTANVNATGASNCGYLWIYTAQTAPSVMYSNVPYQFTDVNGAVTTLLPSNSPGTVTVYTGLNPANAPYTAQIEPGWLTANGLIQTSPNFTITSFNANGMANNPQQTMTVSCSTPSPNPDFGISYGWGSNFVAPLQTGHLYLNICNYACSDTSDVSVSLQMPGNFVPNTSGLTNPIVTGNILTFDILGLSDCQYIHIPFTFPGNTPAGTPYCFQLALSNPNDIYLSNNLDTICGVVLNSYDPNEKLVDQPTNIDPNTVQEFEYVIHFQNDGNFDAMDVVIQDTIAANLDLSTFKYVGAKHGVATSIDPTTRVVTFSFNDINLGQSAVDLEASQGFVVYSISEAAGLQEGSVIENTAYIYFDFNPAIVTNTTYNINELPLGLNESKSEWINLYPNPAEDKIKFSGASVNEVSIYDLTGKLVLNTDNILDNEISLNNLQTGIYQVALKTNNTISTQKLVIKK